MNIKDAYEEIAKLIESSDNDMVEAMKIADEHSISFYYDPVGQGLYKGNGLTLDKALELISSGEYENLDSSDKERVDEVIQNKEDEYEDYECWRSSFC
jgi:hypothetical protein